MAKGKSGGKSKSKKKSSICASPSPSKSVEHTISTRKIANGYVTRQSTYRDGKYQDRETFSPTKPKVEISVGGVKGK